MKQRFNYQLVPFFLWIIFVVLAQSCSPHDRTGETGGTLVAEGIFQEIEFDWDTESEIGFVYVNSENILRITRFNHTANIRIVEGELEFGCGIRVFMVNGNNYRITVFEPDTEAWSRTQAPLESGTFASGEYLDLEIDLASKKMRFFHINSDDMVDFVMLSTTDQIEYSYPVLVPGDNFQLVKNETGKYFMYIFPGANGVPDVEPITEPEDEPEPATPADDKPFVPDRRKQ